MKELNNQEGITNEQQKLDYVQKLRDSIVSGELEVITQFSINFKIKFIEIIKEAKEADVAIKKIGELIIESAKTFDVPTVQNMVDKPHLFQAFLIARKKNEGSFVIKGKEGWQPIKGREGWQPMTASEENETGALLQVICLSYLSSCLTQEEKDDFIATSVQTDYGNDIGASALGTSAKETIYNKEVTTPENIEKIKKLAKTFLEASCVGKKYDVQSDTGIEAEIKSAFGEFYATFGNRVTSFLNSIIRGQLFNCVGIEEQLGNSVRLKDEKKYIDAEALKVLKFYIKQEGMSEEEAKESLTDRYGGLII